MTDFTVLPDGRVVPRTLGANIANPVVPAPRLLTYNPIQAGGASVPPSGPPLPPPTLAGRAKSGLGMLGRGVKGVAGPVGAVTLADAVMGTDPDPGEFSIKPGVGDPMPRLMGEVMQQAHDFGVRLEESGANPSPDQSPFGNIMRQIGGATLQSPARVAAGAKDIVQDPLGTAVHIADTVEAGSKFVIESADEHVPAVADFFLSPNQVSKLREPRLQEQQEDIVRMVEGRQQVDQVAEEMFKLSMGEGGTTATISEPFTLGSVQFPSVPNLPPPPPPADFAEVYAALQNTLPEKPSPEDFKAQQTMSILAGMMSGVLRMRDGNFGEMLLGAGVGSLAGRASSDQAQQQAEAQFKEQMNDFWIRTASIKRAEAEDEASYARRVWEHNNENMLRQYANANNIASMSNQKVTQGKDGKMYLTSITPNGDGTGTRQIRVYEPASDTKTIKDMMKVMSPMIGKEKAETVATTVLKAKNPSKALGLYIVGKARHDGKYTDLIKMVGERVPSFKTDFMQIGTDLDALRIGATEGARGAIRENAQEALLIEAILSNPQLLGESGDFVGLQVPRR